MDIIIYNVFLGASIAFHCIGPLPHADAQTRLIAQLELWKTKVVVDTKQVGGIRYDMSQPVLISDEDSRFGGLKAQCVDK